MLVKFSAHKSERLILARARLGAAGLCANSHSFPSMHLSQGSETWLLSQRWASSEGRVPNLLKSPMVCLIANRFQAHQNSTFNYTSLLLNSEMVTGTYVSSNDAHVIGPIQKKKVHEMAEIVFLMMVYFFFFFPSLFLS